MRFLAWVFAAAGWVAGGASAAGPVVPGLHGKHPLDERQVGAVLIEELRCASCHDGMNRFGLKAPPKLDGVGSRLRPDYLRKFIADPAAVHAGSTMPKLFGGVSEEEKAKAVESISHYLLSLKEEVPEPSKEEIEEDGRTLFHELGCVACHSPRDEDGKELWDAGVIPLSHVPGKFRSGALADFLHHPLKVRPSGRMPDMHLSREEAAVLAEFLEGGDVAPVADSPKPPVEQIAAGKLAFQRYDCTACHDIGKSGAPTLPSGPPLADLDTAGGCLSATPGKAPDFRLDDGQRAAIRAALKSANEPVSADDQIKMRLTQMNCIACHERDGYGGVTEQRDSYFHTTEEALGNEARIPPPLTLAGAKLRPEWMSKVLYDREMIRPYMKTRMPHYGELALDGLPGLFGKVDTMDELVLEPPTRQDGTKIRNGAHLLLGTDGLGCIACHNFNGKESPGMKGLDLMTTYQRLQPAWFYEYMKNPAAFRPGITMPSYWPGGKAVQPDILDGDTHEQLRALWHNFSLGRSARDPKGLVTEDTRLLVTDTVRTYRGRSRVAGFRGIAVGYPGGLNYAFNAQNGSLAAVWSGEFVRVNWRSQGAGDFFPLGKEIKLPQDVGFLQLADDKVPWPLRPIRTKENPINPDPLYPRQHGYAFKGYSFDAQSVPTLRYHCNDIAIEDKTVTAGAGEQAVLRRLFKFSSPEKQTVYFRALTGRIGRFSDTEFQNGDVRITIGPGETLLRPIEDGGQELLIKLTLPKGASTYTIDYALLR